MSIGSIDNMTGPLLENISANPQGMSVNQIAALLDANTAETSVVLQLIQSVGQALQTQVADESTAQNGGHASGNSLNVYA
jgi:hypothetical protein